jgi:hypothetical protein
VEDFTAWANYSQQELSAAEGFWHGMLRPASSSSR